MTKIYYVVLIQRQMQIHIIRHTQPQWSVYTNGRFIECCDDWHNSTSRQCYL